jgi:CheY-like chemotaxis protein
MEPETQARVFEPFFSTKEPGRGTGLGLASVYGIVEQAGGRIGVESAPGQGACFVIDLPQAADAPREDAEPAAERKREGSETLLLVEDQDAVRQVAGRVLRERGYRVLEAADAQDALLQVASASIDLLVTDVVMPGMRGTELAAQLAVTHPRLPVLLVSGNPGIDERMPPETRSSRGFLAKPFSPDALADAVRDAPDARVVAPG